MHRPRRREAKPIPVDVLRGHHCVLRALAVLGGPLSSPEHTGHCSALFSRTLCSQLRGYQCLGLCVHSYSESAGDRSVLPSFLSSIPPVPCPSLACDCCPGRSKDSAVEPLLCPELWKSSFSSDHHPSHYLPCAGRFLSPDELTQAQECFLPPFSPHPASPGSPSFRSAICLNPLRHSAQDVSLSWSRASSSVGGLSILLEHLDPGGLRSLSSAPLQTAQLSGFSIPQALPIQGLSP